MLLGVLQDIQREYTKEKSKAMKHKRLIERNYVLTHTHTHTLYIYILLPSNNQQNVANTCTQHNTHSITHMCKVGVYFSLSLQQVHVITHATITRI